MMIRAAQADDATEICALLRRSIIELCQADHNGEVKILGEWLENKTPENVGRWIESREAHFLVALDDQMIAAAGAITRKGEVLLLYVLPEARFCGFSKALLQHLETCARRDGARLAELTSTATAYPFYRAAGYSGEPAGQREFRPNFARMSRRLDHSEAGT
jgi:GNAT superfamily N-acetyltransferase